MKITWIKIDIEAVTAYQPPFFSGSMLRGALGVTLKRMVCINPSYQCSGCFATATCLYYDFFEKVNLYHPYRIVSALGMKHLAFSIYLFEDRVAQMPYILSAMKKSLEETGLGKDQQKVKVANIHVGVHLVYDGERFLPIDRVQPCSTSVEECYRDVRLEFRMPLRMKMNNHLIYHTPSLPTLITTIHHRYRALKGLPSQKLGYRIEGEIEKSDLHYLDLYRYSNRQKCRMKLGGVIGSVVIRGLDERSYGYLKIGEVIGAGKQTVFGLGDYRLTPLKEYQ
ncbi:MAG: hypothetical protein DSY46_02275 [Hydrogenimonas sp.]|nr:MAG: hypothetical protein DSY46_02275 [Hydrogenimonas sp.]